MCSSDLASELARSNYDERLKLARLSMLQFNADVLDGRVIDEATQHAAKHVGFESPNSAKTYFVSTTSLDTVAFRFAADRGYVTRTSANREGNTHFIVETFRPRHGAVDFGSFKLTNPEWKNYYPRQKEVALAGGIDPSAVRRIYVIGPYGPGERIPTSGPEKHGKILKIFERDGENPNRIWTLLRNSKGDRKSTRLNSSHT